MISLPHDHSKRIEVSNDLMCWWNDLLGMIDGAAIFPIRCDAGGPEGVAANRFG